MEIKTISEITRIWGRTLEEIKSSLNDELSFGTFFADSYADSLSGSTFIVYVNSSLTKNLINNKYKDIVENALRKVTQTNFDVKFICDEDLEDEIASNKDEVVNTDPVFFKDARLNPNFTFENFVVGPSNKFAYQGALMCARTPGQIYSPLLIYSHSGLGKTHLLNAMGNAMISLNPKMKVLYISGDDFVEEFVRLVTTHMDQSLVSFFKTSVDCLLIDDIQFLTGREQTMENFFNVFETLFKQGKQIVITSDQPPERLNALDERLRTRFSSGLVLEIKQPDISTSEEILKTKIEANNLSVSTFDPEVISYLASKFSSNVRELEGALNRLIFYSITMKESSYITLELAKESLEGLIVSKESVKTINEDKIISIVADYYNLTPSQLKGKIRTSQIALARHIAMYLIYSLMNVSTIKIGKIFGGKDHSSVLSAIKKIEKGIKEDPATKEVIDELTTLIKK